MLPATIRRAVARHGATVHRLAMADRTAHPATVDRMGRRVMVGRMDRRVTAAGTVRPAAADTLPEVVVVIPVVVVAIPAVDITKARDGDNNVRKTGKLM